MPVSRRRFLLAVAGLAATGLVPRSSAAASDERPVYFVPLDDYQELPPDCYASHLIQPRAIILHWDGNRNGRELWKVAVTYQTLAYVRQSAHFAVDDRRVWQMLPMYPGRVQESYGAKGYNDIAINIEMAGRDFDVPEFAPAPEQVRLTVRLVSQLMDYYHLPFENVLGHYERDDRGLKKDPGEKFMAGFREKLSAYRASLSPTKQQLLEAGG